MLTSRKTLITTTVVVAALFVIANPLGDRHHGLGRHHKVLAVLGEVTWVAFLIGAVVLIVLCVLAVARAARTRRATH